MTVVSQTIEAFIMAVNRHQLGAPQRCPVCASYQIRAEHAGDGGWLRVCETCGWQAPAEPLSPAVDHDLAGESGEAEEAGSQPAPEGECVEPQDLGIYLSPDQARAVLEQASNRAAAERIREDWANPFAFFFPEDASLADVHRIAYTTFNNAPPRPATELAYACGETACVNPNHVRETALPADTRWMCGIVEKVTFRHGRLELHISTHEDGLQRVLVDHAMLNRYGFGDGSSLVERVVFFSQPDTQGCVNLMPVQRRTDHANGSAITGWLQPPSTITDQNCPELGQPD